MELRHWLRFTVVFLGSWGTCRGMVYDDYSDGYGPCYRPCDGGAPRICYYKITVEIYPTLSGACGDCEDGKEEDCLLPQCVSADGVERTVFAMNRRIPGPGIHICQGDRLMVDLEVLLPGHQETFHWHGILQKGTPYMDGVPMITQCPVESGQTFRYNFEVPESGTYFYHSHSGINKANGVAGALVCRKPKSSDPHGHLYDKDRAQDTIVLQDWFSTADAEFLFPGSKKRVVGQTATSILCNGRGRTNKTNDDGTREETKTILSEFFVEPGLRYRFRIINAGSMNCPIEIMFEKHTALLIASDGVDIQPVEVGSIISFSGERYSFVLKTDQPISAYWIHMRTTGFCGERANVVQQWAILRYKGWRGPPPSPRPDGRSNWPGPVFGDPGVECGTPGYVCPTEIRSLTLPNWPSPHYTSIMNEPDLTVVIPVGFYLYDYPELYRPTVYDQFLAVGSLNLAGYLNNISFQEPSTCLLTNPGKVVVCDGTHLPKKCLGRNVCECTHLVELPLGKIIDLLIVDTTTILNKGPFLSHPMHIHGHNFLVLNWGGIGDYSNGYDRVQILSEMARTGRLPPPKPYSPFKDTVSLPGTGYVRVRIFTDNPGVWFFHCHFTFHMASGMEMAFQTGDASDFPPIPEGFPTCGSYKSDV